MVERSGGTEQREGALAGQVVVVTGAAKGIGLGCARVMGRAGASVAVVDVDAAACAAGVQELRELGIVAETYLCNVGLADDVNRMIAGVVQRFDRIDVVVNELHSAGVSPDPAHEEEQS